MLVMTIEGDRQGSTYERRYDLRRLNEQARRVFVLMGDGEWHTLAEISAATGDSTPSISARLRDFRKSQFGGHEVERRARNRFCGIYEYRLILNETVSLV